MGGEYSVYNGCDRDVDFGENLGAWVTIPKGTYLTQSCPGVFNGKTQYSGEGEGYGASYVNRGGMNACDKSDCYAVCQ